MKKLITSATMLLIILSLQSNGQTHTAYVEKYVSTSNYEAKADVNSKVISKFQKQFPSATDVSFGKSKEGYVVVNFVLNKIHQLVFLNKNGNVLSAILYYTPEELPSEVRSNIAQNYPCFTIKGAQEIHHDGNKVYLVTIGNNYQWKVIRVVNDEMDIYEQHTY